MISFKFARWCLVSQLNNDIGVGAHVAMMKRLLIKDASILPYQRTAWRFWCQNVYIPIEDQSLRPLSLLAAPCLCKLLRFWTCLQMILAKHVFIAVFLCIVVNERLLFYYSWANWTRCENSKLHSAMSAGPLCQKPSVPSGFERVSVCHL